MKKVFFTATLSLIIPLMMLASDPEKKGSTMPEYGNWKTFTTKDGLPANKIYCVRADGDRIWVGTSHGLALYEDGKFKVYTTEDGLRRTTVYSLLMSVNLQEIYGWVLLEE